MFVALQDWAFIQSRIETVPTNLTAVEYLWLEEKKKTPTEPAAETHPHDEEHSEEIISSAMDITDD